MTQIDARLLQTDKGSYVSFSTASVELWHKLPDSVVEEINAMVVQEQEVLERLRVNDPALYRTVYFKKLGVAPLKVVLRSTEELTMLAFFVECQTVCASKTWQLEQIESFQRYHLRG